MTSKSDNAPNTPSKSTESLQTDDSSIGVRDQLGLLLQNTHALIAVYDQQDRLRYANNAFQASYFVDPEEGLTWYELVKRNYHHKRATVINTSDFETWALSVLSRRGKVAQRSFETDMHDGRWINVVETVLPGGWSLYVGIDVTNLRASERDLRQGRDLALIASETDELTGISNRRHIMAMLEQVVDQHPCSETSAGCACILDIDHFKKINDELGHQKGDKALCAFTRVVRNTVRLADGFGRIGGEEFLLIMPGVPLKEGLTIMERIFSNVRNTALIADQPDRQLTFSAGMTSICAPDTASEVYRRADEALFVSKGNGRNQLTISEQNQD
jgi:diguanylate cyclase (GGDEF)-like protein